MNSPDSDRPDSFMARQLGRLPGLTAHVAARALSLVTGVAVAVVLHYLLYRVGLPSKPFIYVAF